MKQMLFVLGMMMVAAPVAAEPSSAQLQAVDDSGELTEAELLERVQLLTMVDPRPPVPAAQGALGAAIGQLGFSLVTGGSGSGQDLAVARD